MEEQLFYENESGVLTVKLPKEIDHHSVLRLRGQIDDMLLQAKPQKLVLDLTQTQFMDSSGLGLILGRAKLTKELNMDYLLVNPNAATQKILVMSGVDKLIAIQAWGR